MERTALTIDRTNSVLVQDQVTTDLRRRIEEARESTGRLVDFIVVRHCAVGVLITATSRVTITFAITEQKEEP